MDKQKIVYVALDDENRYELPFPVYITTGNDYYVTMIMIVGELIKGLLERIEKEKNYE